MLPEHKQILGFFFDADADPPKPCRQTFRRQLSADYLTPATARQHTLLTTSDRKALSQDDVTLRHTVSSTLMTLRPTSSLPSLHPTSAEPRFEKESHCSGGSDVSSKLRKVSGSWETRTGHLASQVELQTLHAVLTLCCPKCPICH